MHRGCLCSHVMSANIFKRGCGPYTALSVATGTGPTCWVSVPQPVVLNELLQAHDVSLELHLQL